MGFRVFWIAVSVFVSVGLSNAQTADVDRQTKANELLAKFDQAPHQTLRRPELETLARDVQSYLNSLTPRDPKTGLIDESLLFPAEKALVKKQDYLLRFLNLRKNLDSCYSEGGKAGRNLVPQMYLDAADEKNLATCRLEENLPLDTSNLNQIEDIYKHLNSSVAIRSQKDIGQIKKNNPGITDQKTDEIASLYQLKKKIWDESSRQSLKNLIYLKHRYQFAFGSDLIDYSAEAARICGKPCAAKDLAALVAEAKSYHQSLVELEDRYTQPRAYTADGVYRSICSSIESDDREIARIRKRLDGVSRKDNLYKNYSEDLKKANSKRLEKLMSGGEGHGLLLFTESFRKAHYRLDCTSKTLGTPNGVNQLNRALRQAVEGVYDHARIMKDEMKDDGDRRLLERIKLKDRPDHVYASIAKMAKYSPNGLSRAMMASPEYAKFGCQITRAVEEQDREDKRWRETSQNALIFGGLLVAGASLLCPPAGLAASLMLGSGEVGLAYQQYTDDEQAYRATQGGVSSGGMAGSRQNQASVIEQEKQKEESFNNLVAASAMTGLGTVGDLAVIGKGTRSIDSGLPDYRRAKENIGRHYDEVQKVADANNQIVLVRQTKAASAQHWDKADFVTKPMSIKNKTDSRTGLIYPVQRAKGEAVKPGEYGLSDRLPDGHRWETKGDLEKRPYLVNKDGMPVTGDMDGYAVSIQPGERPIKDNHGIYYRSEKDATDQLNQQRPYADLHNHGSSVLYKGGTIGGTDDVLEGVFPKKFAAELKKENPDLYQRLHKVNPITQTETFVIDLNGVTKVSSEKHSHDDLVDVILLAHKHNIQIPIPRILLNDPGYRKLLAPIAEEDYLNRIGGSQDRIRNRSK